jgi:hypothetical protein
LAARWWPRDRARTAEHPDQAWQDFRYTATGFRGQHNLIRADKYFSTDLGISKQFRLPKEGMSLVFRWDIFNLTNSAYFDATSLSASPASPGTFGDYTKVLGGPRQMQASLRFQF